MDLRRRGSMEEPEINIISMVDIVLVILLFFMVTTTFIHQSNLGLQLPDASRAQPGVPKSPITIDLSATGQVMVNGQPVPMANLAARLKSLAGDDSKRLIVLRADKNATQQYVIDVLNSAQEAGLYRVSFATLNPHS